MKSNAINDLKDDGTALRAGFESMMSVRLLPGIGLEKPDFVRNWETATMDFLIIKDWVADILALEKWLTSGYKTSEIFEISEISTIDKTSDVFKTSEVSTDMDKTDKTSEIFEISEVSTKEVSTIKTLRDIAQDIDKTSDIFEISEVSTIKTLRDLAQEIDKTSDIFEISEVSTIDKTSDVFKTSEVSTEEVSTDTDKTSDIFEISEVSTIDTNTVSDNSLATMGQEMLELYSQLSFEEAKLAVFTGEREGALENFSVYPDEEAIFSIDPSFQSFFGSEPQRAEPIRDNYLIHNQSDRKIPSNSPLQNGGMPAVAEARAENSVMTSRGMPAVAEAGAENSVMMSRGMPAVAEAGAENSVMRLRGMPAVAEAGAENSVITSTESPAVAEISAHADNSLITPSNMNNEGSGPSNDKHFRETLSVSVIPPEAKLPVTAEPAGEPDREFILKTIIKEVESDYRRHYGEL
jgi:hypothetical protein